MIRIQEEDFDLGAEITALRSSRTDIGAIVSFTGTVRDQAGSVTEMMLEHYPSMTETELARIEQEAQARWPLQASLIVHRVGSLKPGDNIVLVVTASAHRDAAFDRGLSDNATFERGHLHAKFIDRHAEFGAEIFDCRIGCVDYEAFGFKLGRAGSKPA